MTTNQQLPQRLNPETDLTWARTGTEYFLDLMARIDQPQLADPSLLSGWTRGHVIAHIGYNARALHRLLTWARTGEELPMYDSSEQRSEEIESGATLSKDALLSLVTNSDADLATAWRTLPPDRWSFPVRTAQGRTVTVSETAWMRAREVWIHAVDLNTGGSFDHFPHRRTHRRRHPNLAPTSPQPHHQPQPDRPRLAHHRRHPHRQLRHRHRSQHRPVAHWTRATQHSPSPPRRRAKTSNMAMS
jgi:uncharacterized protein (TIGR03083 family)